MNTKIDHYLNQLFEGLNLSDELKEELRLNLNDKYDDLISDGMDADAAYKLVISGIGDLEELEQQPNTINQNVEINISQAPNRNLKIGAAVFLFIMSVVPLIVFEEYVPGLEALGISIMFLLIASGVVILITLPKETNINSNKKDMPKESKSSEQEYEPLKKLQSMINGLIWLCALLVFFGLNYLHVRQSWLIFVIAVLGTKLAQTVLLKENDSDGKELIITLIWCLVVIAFFTFRFSYSWLFFVIGAILTQVTNIAFELKGVKHEK